MTALLVTPLAAFSGADLFGLIASFLVCAYLIYALLRGEDL